MRSSLKQNRLAGLAQAKDIFDKEDEIKKDVNDFLSKRDLDVEALWKKYKKCGRAMYYSEELEQFVRICHHYEKVGALVKRGYLDFKLYL
jgi:acetyl-CoA carboxylase beta subunit